MYKTRLLWLVSLFILWGRQPKALLCLWKVSKLHKLFLKFTLGPWHNAQNPLSNALDSYLRPCWSECEIQLCSRHHFKARLKKEAVFVYFFQCLLMETKIFETLQLALQKRAALFTLYRNLCGFYAESLYHQRKQLGLVCMDHILLKTFFGPLVLTYFSC